MSLWKPVNVSRKELEIGKEQAISKAELKLLSGLTQEGAWDWKGTGDEQGWFEAFEWFNRGRVVGLRGNW